MLGDPRQTRAPRAAVAALVALLGGGCHLVFPFGVVGADGTAASDAASADLGPLDGPTKDGPPLDGPPPDGPPLDGPTKDAPTKDAPTKDAPTKDAALPPDLKPDGGGIVGTFVTVIKGTFIMGSPAGEPCREGDEAQHIVTLTHDVSFQTHEVTQAQYQTLMGSDPSFQKTCAPDCPVENVSWHQAAAYCNALSTKQGLTSCYACSGGGSTTSCQETAVYAGKQIYNCPGYRLPTEAEWEYAYRAKTTTAFYSGANSPLGCFGCTQQDANADKIAWYCVNAGGTKHQVGQKLKNLWGLYDMAGNVGEWCHDGYQLLLGTSPVTDPVVAPGSEQVIRGGSWFYTAPFLRAADRFKMKPSSSSSGVGFRCVRSS